MEKEPFWKTKSLCEMTPTEWESLCDRCGICCLEKMEDKETSEIVLTPISCQFLETVNCECLIYERRARINRDCLELSPNNLKDLTWLPGTCAYRCVYEGRDLEWWHPLLSGNPETVHQAGISVRDKVLPGRYVHPEEVLVKDTPIE